LSVVVTGSGRASGRPDTVEVDIGVSVISQTVQEATASAAARADGLIAALTVNGVEAEDIATAGYSIQPEYDYSGNAQRLTGYRADNTLRVRIRDIAATGSIFDAVGAAAGDDTRIDHLRFTVDDEAGLAATARTAAWDDAAAKASQLASLAGRALGAAINITETMGTPPIPVRGVAMDMAMAERATTPIQPGTTSVTVTLQVEFDLTG
jgi:hypothetical protein